MSCANLPRAATACAFSIRCAPMCMAPMRRETLEGAELQVADVRDAAAVARALAGVDAVIHLAAKVGLGVDVYDLPDYAGSNDAGTAVLLAEMARAGVDAADAWRVRWWSTAKASRRAPSTAWCGRRRARRRRSPPGSSSRRARSAASRLATALVDETTPFDPRNAYATSKVAQEFYAGNWARLTGGAADRAALSQCLRAGHAARHALCRRRRDLHVGAAARRSAPGVRGRQSAARFRPCPRRGRVPRFLRAKARPRA